ncbi:adenosine kinase-like protein [Leishmania donovani]|uniref:Adenosine kinase n=1 Tax=Leishmania donovani TaxID=5661 RepID=A0A504WUD7_LEIDO|nr:adenosine kinase-like protein [Leishmania donovani]TPP40246.1 pfkB carbohydrate kinase family protein [Leishmania donovani]TPP46760.1 pfkB carbohydrate kinase family protein [Leishmania donovani]CAJ1992720.1 adenosine kinase-like protein [Leishmania donovani]CBZ37815.1 adenosine kinase-like protein [Leishmania donovani]VDZ48552.1 adenosine_kinase-like_protein/GeneDB:LmjF.34.3600 [Leishmania donovani]
MGLETLSNGTSPAPISVVCFGHPLLDMMATVENDFLREHNVEPGSVTLAAPEQLVLFSKLLDEFKDQVDYVPGGAAMNTARVLAWMLPDAHIAYVGALGKDRFAEILKSALTKAGVEQLFEECEDKPTGTCAGLVVQKDRTLLANLGAAVTLSLTHIQTDAVQSAIEKASLYYAEGFFLNTASSPNNLLYVAHHAHLHGKLFCFNLNAPYISIAFESRLHVLLPHVDILFGSDEDLLTYASVRWPHDFDLSTLGTVMHANSRRHEAFVRCLARISMLPRANSARPRLVVGTCGPHDTYVACGDHVRSYPVPPMAQEEMVDVNGAGDAFVAGFLAQYIVNRDESTSVVVGHASAQNCIRHNGAVVSGAPPALTRRISGTTEPVMTANSA